MRMITILICIYGAISMLGKRVKEVVRLVHLWTGLLFGSILVVLGLTGVALAWVDELDAWLNPSLLTVAPVPGAPARITPAMAQALVDRLALDPAYGKPNQLVFPDMPGGVAVAWYRPRVKTSSPWEVDVARQVMVDPVRLSVTGERHWGEAGLSRPLLMPTLFHLHRYLLAGENGKLVVALTGVSLLLTSFTGLVLWWPRLAWRALWQSVSVRYGGNWTRFNFQLHRAFGFFALPVFLMLAVSGVYFNMPAWVTPAVGAVAPLTPTKAAVNRSEPSAVRIDLADAVAVAQARFPSARVGRVTLPVKSGQPYEVRLRQDGELRQGSGATRVSIDAGDASVLKVVDPLAARGGDKFINWLFPLHSGEAFGVTGRAFISVFGLAPLIFFATGVVVWLKLRRKSGPARAPQRAGATGTGGVRIAALRTSLRLASMPWLIRFWTGMFR